MSDDLNITPGSCSADGSAEDEYEEISSDEVDRVCAILDDLIDTVASENIQHYLEEAANHILSLVYDETDFEGVIEEEHDEAA